MQSLPKIWLLYFSGIHATNCSSKIKRGLGGSESTQGTTYRWCPGLLGINKKLTLRQSLFQSKVTSDRISGETHQKKKRNNVKKHKRSWRTTVTSLYICIHRGFTFFSIGPPICSIQICLVRELGIDSQPKWEQKNFKYNNIIQHSYLKITVTKCYRTVVNEKGQIVK